MNANNAAQFLPLIQALTDGKTLQYTHDNGFRWTDIADTNDTGFYGNPSNYRIKPSPTYRPWKPEEIPVGKLVRMKNISFIPSLIIGADDAAKSALPVDDKVAWLTNDAMLNDYEYSLDNGKTWLPCGVLVNE